MTALGTPRRSRSLLAVLCAANLALTAACEPTVRDEDDQPRVREYVALGDSYTSAPLVPEPVPAQGCHRSTGNYPSLAAALLDAVLVDRSCASASTEAMTESQRRGVRPQLSGLAPTTDLVTLSIGGGNGSLFPKLVGGCAGVAHLDPEGAPCRETVERRGDDLSALVRRTGRQIEEVIGLVREKAPEARVLLVGYPSIFPAQGSCPERLPLAAGDVTFAAEVMAELDQEMREAAERAEVEFVDVHAATKGHDICAKDPWIQGRGNAEDAMEYHPKPKEQQVVARLLLDLIR